SSSRRARSTGRRSWPSPSARRPARDPRVTSSAVDHPDPTLAEPPPVHRMVAAVLALVGVLISVYMMLYHLGMIGSILCGTGGCETVQNSPWASFFGVPVPLIGLVGYGIMFAVALLGIQ